MKTFEQQLLEEAYKDVLAGIKTIDLDFQLIDEGIKDFLIKSLKNVIPFAVAVGIASSATNANAQDIAKMYNVSGRNVYSSLDKEGFIKQQEQNLKSDSPTPAEGQYATMTKRDQIDLGKKIQQLHNVYIEIIKEREIKTGFITATIEIEGEIFAASQIQANNMAAKLVKELLEKNNMTLKGLNVIQEEQVQLFPFTVRAIVDIPKTLLANVD
jgi:hypothetical protein